ncbi:MAG: hypothetical protein JHC73_14005 [Dolichospermum sp.]|nr:hypothetical protein [Dolichospermum sp.]
MICKPPSVPPVKCQIKKVSLPHNIGNCCKAIAKSIHNDSIQLQRSLNQLPVVWPLHLLCFPTPGQIPCSQG